MRRPERSNRIDCSHRREERKFRVLIKRASFNCAPETSGIAQLTVKESEAPAWVSVTLVVVVVVWRILFNESQI